MLSYRHSFHAGNFADLVKHIVLVEILEHLTKKEKPFEYIDTHSGAGLYDLRSAESRKLQEHSAGIGKLVPAEYPDLARYFDVIKSFNEGVSQHFYPGSPCIASYFLRPQDRAWLFELHPQDYKLLESSMSANKKVKVQCQDGFTGLNALIPPVSRRALVLIDPSYEIKSDYDLVIKQLVKACRKFSNGIYALWYPVVDRVKINKMQAMLVDSGITNIQRFELGLSADSIERGMTSAGMIVINPPWQLYKKMSAVLPVLAENLSEDSNRFFKCDVLVGE